MEKSASELSKLGRSLSSGPHLLCSATAIVVPRVTRRPKNKESVRVVRQDESKTTTANFK
jgi:hypothetical protein